jgi:hypothetical protein
MDRFSTRLAASLIEDRHREAAATRRFIDLPRIGSDSTAAAGHTGAPALGRTLSALLRPLRFRIGAR